MKRLMLVCAIAIAAIGALTVTLYGHRERTDLRRSPDGRWIVHEWGTFTVLQDADGRAIRGINTDDEPVPDFVHRHPERLVPRAGVLPPAMFMKGIPFAHPDVAMRLETPVLYFYPPHDAELPTTVDVGVAMHGGWLSEFYPHATADAPGVVRVEQDDGNFHHRVGPLRPDAVGRLTWRSLRVGVEGEPVATDAPVWLAPRAVRSAMIETTGGERERYVFYRGVANRLSPLKMVRSDDGATLTASVDAASGVDPAWTPSTIWMVDIRDDGSLAFRTTAEVDAPQPTNFDRNAYHRSNLADLRASMRKALIADGLFDDEADAMLNTWDASYFRAPGMRVFYLVPQSWTDAVMPLSLSVDADVRRTMVGRVELVTPQHESALDRIAAGPVIGPMWVQVHAYDKFTARFADIDALASSGLDLPADLKAYVELGRFRDSLILDRIARKPTKSLREFALQSGIYPLGIAPERAE